MAFDFPSSPIVGQQFTPAGGPTFTWNGYGWTLAQASITGFSTTLDPQKQTPPTNSVTQFTNGNLTFTKTEAANNYRCAVSFPAVRLGMLYFEAQPFGPVVANNIIGFGCGNTNFTASGSGGNYPGINTASLGIGSAGNFYYGGSNLGGFPTWVANDWIGVCCDTVLGGLAIRNITTGGNWNNVAGGNPAATPPTGIQTGYPNVTNNYGGMIAIACAYNQNCGWVLNFDGPFLGPVPSVCRKWGGGSIP